MSSASKYPPIEGPLENHAFEGNPLKRSKVERLTGVGWIELGAFPATVEGLSRAVRCYKRARAQPNQMGIALWIGPTLAACELARSVRAFYKSGPPAIVMPVLTVSGEPAAPADDAGEDELEDDDAGDDDP